MNLIGVTKGGSVLVEMFMAELRQLKELAAVLLALPEDPAHSPARPPSEGAGGPAPEAAKSKKPQRAQRAQRAKPSAAAKPRGRKTSPAVNRNKKCRQCGRAFYDDSRTNTRRWCGPGECRMAGEIAGRHPPRETVDGKIPDHKPGC